MLRLAHSEKKLKRTVLITGSTVFFLIQHLYSATSKLVLRRGGPKIGSNVQDMSTGGMEEGVGGVW